MLIPDIATMPMVSISDWQDSLGLVGNSLSHGLNHGATLFAQRVEDPQILENIQKSFQNFIKSGQAWALAIGFVMGYMFRGFTSY